MGLASRGDPGESRASQENGAHSMLGEIDFRLFKLCAWCKSELIYKELGLTFKPSFLSLKFGSYIFTSFQMPSR